MSRSIRTAVLAVAVLATTAFASAAAPTISERTAANLQGPKGSPVSHGTEGSVPSLTGNSARLTTTVDLTGFQSIDDGFPGPDNSQLLVSIAPNAQITGVSFSNLAIQLSNGSFGSEFVISTNNSANTGVAGTFWDYRPFPTANSATPTALGPITGAFTSPSNQFASGPFPLLADGQLLLYVYETFDDAGTDATVTSGTLTITYTVVPEPTTLAALGLGGLLLRRRRA